MTTQQYREVKRNAAVGERIKVVIGGTHGDGFHNVGDIRHVIFADRWSNGSGVSVSERNYVATRWDEGTGINHNRYVVLEPIAEPIAPSPLSSDPLYAAFLQFVADNADGIRAILPEVEALATQAPAQLAPVKTLRRADVITNARADVAKITADIYGDGDPDVYSQYGVAGHMRVNFEVNREKRMVVALVGWRYCPGIRDRGIATCSPADVFHAEIGKAIALRKALGLAVPTEYTDAPQPDKPRVGALVKDDLGVGIVTSYDGHRGIDVNGGPCNGGFWTLTDGALGATVIDDTDVDYGAVSAKGVAA